MSNAGPWLSKLWYTCAMIHYAIIKNKEVNLEVLTGKECLPYNVKRNKIEVIVSFKKTE